ncbi:hypothetical protein FACS1894216_01320 [Synergistales bacterium]|nr:hypothetical protein FACS1894216_01320 [Synergistales bacterium]
MAKQGRLDYGSIETLLHFDFPYFGETAATAGWESGLRNDANWNEKWEKVGAVKLVGTEQPVDEVVAGCPKFGYRCLGGNNSTSIRTTNPAPAWNLNSSNDYEFEFFYRLTNNAPVSVLQFFDSGNNSLGRFWLGGIEGVTFFMPSWNLNVQNGVAITPNTWHHMLARFKAGVYTFYFDGQQTATATYPGGSILQVSTVELYSGENYIDEFVFRTSAGTGPPVVPTQPYQGTLKAKDMGGFGDGSFGDAAFTSGTTDINTTSKIVKLSETLYELEGTQSAGIYGNFSVGQEIMVHVSSLYNGNTATLGLYGFAKIVNANGVALTLDKDPIPELSAQGYRDAWVTAILVPNYNNLTIGENSIITPHNYTGTGGGIIAFRVKETLTLNGKLVPAFTAPHREDDRYGDHLVNLEHFYLTGNVFVAAKNIVGGANARIGWPVGDGYLPGNGGDCTSHFHMTLPLVGGSVLGYLSNDDNSELATQTRETVSGVCRAGFGHYSSPNIICIADSMRMNKSTINNGGIGGGGVGAYSGAYGSPGPEYSFGGDAFMPGGTGVRRGCCYASGSGGSGGGGVGGGGGGGASTSARGYWASGGQPGKPVGTAVGGTPTGNGQGNGNGLAGVGNGQYTGGSGGGGGADFSTNSAETGYEPTRSHYSAGGNGGTLTAGGVLPPTGLDYYNSPMVSGYTGGPGGSPGGAGYAGGRGGLASDQRRGNYEFYSDSYYGAFGGKGSGTGFCYIACKTLLSA